MFARISPAVAGARPLAYLAEPAIFEAVRVEFPKIVEGFQSGRCIASGTQRRVLNLDKLKSTS